MGILKRLLVEQETKKAFSTTLFAEIYNLDLPDELFTIYSSIFAVTVGEVIRELYPELDFEYMVYYDIEYKYDRLPYIYIISDEFHLYNLTSKGFFSIKKLQKMLQLQNAMSYYIGGSREELKTYIVEMTKEDGSYHKFDHKIDYLFTVNEPLKKVLLEAFTKKPNVNIEQLYNLIKSEYNWKNPFYRGMSGDKAKPFGIGETFANRKPRDTDNFLHELVEVLRENGMEQWKKIPSRKKLALFLTKDAEAAKLYGFLYYVFLPNKPIIVGCNKTDQTDDVFIDLEHMLSVIRVFGEDEDLSDYPFLNALCNSLTISEYMSSIGNNYNNLYKAITDEINHIHDNQGALDDDLVNKYSMFWAGIGNYFAQAMKVIVTLQPNVFNEKLTPNYYEFVVNVDKYLYVRHDIIEDNFDIDIEQGIFTIK